MFLNQLVSLKPSHVCDIFDKLIHPILSYGCAVWGFIQGILVERMHLKFCKQERQGKEMFYLSTHSTHFIYGYMASDIW